ncbi:pilus assembly protein PilM [Lentisphaerota bacterium WC36G]|nr:pilus assembly protein PilM [Lentisphaerae bacterium WC36]
MAKSESILAIDIGSDSLKFAEFLYPAEGGLCLEKFSFSEYPVDTNNPNLEVVNSILKDKLKDFSSKNVRVSLSGKSSFVRFANNLALGGESSERIEQIIAYEALQNIPYAANEIAWDYQLLNDPNAEDSNGEADVMIVVVKNDFITSIIETIEGIGKNVISVEVSPSASYNACYANDVGYDGCELLINIGGKSTTLLFLDHGNLFIRTINIAGHTITQQIAKEFGVPYKKAEEMKRRHGFVALGGAYEEPDSQVAATVSKIVRNVMTRLHGEINRSINVYRSQHSGSAPKKVYLAGGSSIMAYAPRFFSEKLRVPVEFLNPFKVLTISENIDKQKLSEVAHTFSEVIGLGLSHGLHCPVEISLVPEKIKQQRDFAKKRIYFVASAITVIMLLVVNLYTLKSVAKHMGDVANVAAKDSCNFEKIHEDIKKINGDVGTLATDFEADLKRLQERTKWTQILNDFQSRLPDNVWIEAFDPNGTVATTGSMNYDDEEGSRRSAQKPSFSFGAYSSGQGGSSSNYDDEEGSSKGPAFVVKLDVKTIVITCSAFVENDNKSKTAADIYRENLLKSPWVDLTSSSAQKNPITMPIFKPVQPGENIEQFTLVVPIKENIEVAQDNESAIQNN